MDAKIPQSPRNWSPPNSELLPDIVQIHSRNIGINSPRETVFSGDLSRKGALTRRNHRDGFVVFNDEEWKHRRQKVQDIPISPDEKVYLALWMRETRWLNRERSRYISFLKKRRDDVDNLSLSKPLGDFGVIGGRIVYSPRDVALPIEKSSDIRPIHTGIV